MDISLLTFATLQFSISCTFFSSGQNIRHGEVIHNDVLEISTHSLWQLYGHSLQEKLSERISLLKNAVATSYVIFVHMSYFYPHVIKN